MGVEVSKLSRFTINTQFPATAKIGSNSCDITMPATWFEGGESKTYVADMDVPDGAILMPIIQQGYLNYFVGNGYAWQNDNWSEEVWIERLSSTRVRLVFYVLNKSASSLQHQGNYFALHLSTFKVP